MRRNRMVSTLVTLALVLMALPAADAGAATIKLSDYWVSKGLGDSWTYGYTQPTGLPDFTVAITLITGNDYNGKYRIGDYLDDDGITTRYQIVSYDNTYYYLHYDSKGDMSYDPAAQIPIIQELETVVPHPLKPTTDAWYFKRLASLTVPAGTYYDILLKIDLDLSFGPNAANTYFQLPDTVTYGVTDATWYARHGGNC